MNTRNAQITKFRLIFEISLLASVVSSQKHYVHCLPGRSWPHCFTYRRPNLTQSSCTYFKQLFSIKKKNLTQCMPFSNEDLSEIGVKIEKKSRNQFQFLSRYQLFLVQISAAWGVRGKEMIRIQRHHTNLFLPDPPENCHLTCFSKKLPKIFIFMAIF